VPDITGLFARSSNSSLNAGYYAEIVYGALIMIFMIAAPQGLNGVIRGLGKRAQDAVTNFRRRPGGSSSAGTSNQPVS